MSLPFFSPDERSEVRGQIAEVAPDLNLVPCLLRIFVWFVAALCGSGFSPLPSDLEPYLPGQEVKGGRSDCRGYS